MNNSTTEREVLTMYYTQEQIDRANQADLVSFLQSQGEQLTRAEVAELQKIRKCVDIALKAEQPEQTQNHTKRQEQER